MSALIETLRANAKAAPLFSTLMEAAADRIEELEKSQETRALIFGGEYMRNKENENPPGRSTGYPNGGKLDLMDYLDGE